MRALIVLACGVVLTGCAVTGPNMAEVRPRVADVDQSQGRIFFYRRSEVLPRGQRYQRLDIAVNGRTVGVATVGASFFVDAEPGWKTVSIGSGPTANLAFELQAAETRYVRAEVVMGWIDNTPQLSEVDHAVGEAEMAETKYYGSLDSRTSLSPRDLALLQCQREADGLPPAFVHPPSGTSADVVAGALMAYSAISRATKSAQIQEECMARKGFVSQ